MICRQIIHCTTLTRTLLLEAMPWMNQLKSKSKKINVRFWFISKEERQKSKNNILSVSLLITPLNDFSPLTRNTPATV